MCISSVRNEIEYFSEIEINVKNWLFVFFPKNAPKHSHLNRPARGPTLLVIISTGISSLFLLTMSTFFDFLKTFKNQYF